MVSVGIRLTDQVFPKPEEEIFELNKSGNPVMNLNGLDKNGKAHINRIVLTRSAAVELLRAESPSCIWVRLLNHITDNTLTFREPFELVQKTKFEVDDYALAPSDERVYRRCRLTDIRGNLIKVFFIDDAVTAWVKQDCLAEISEHYMYYPWQAIQVSMLGVHPAMQSFSEPEKWSVEVCDELDKILAKDQFPLLKVEVGISSVVFNDYAKPIPVLLNGLESEYDGKTISISEILTRKAFSGVVTVPIHDAALHIVYDREESVPDPMTPLDFHISFPSDWKKEKESQKTQEEGPLSSERLSELGDWDPRQNRIEMLSIEELGRAYGFPNRGYGAKIMLAVEGKCTKSPYEWYARPILKVGSNEKKELVEWTANRRADEEHLSEVDTVDWMMYGNDQLLALAEKLDTYYSNPKNRKPLKSEEIQTMRSEGHEVFAICAVNEEKAMYTGEWQRVIILNCDDFAEVRFLDSGGRDMVLTSSLYRIHRQHCLFPPMCLQFAMYGISTRINKARGDKRWNVKETSNFKICLREDVPIFIDLKDLGYLTPNKNDHRPFMTNHVLLVRDVTYNDETKTLLDRFVGNRDGCAEKVSNVPSEWRR